MTKQKKQKKKINTYNSINYSKKRYNDNSYIKELLNELGHKQKLN